MPFDNKSLPCLLDIWFIISTGDEFLKIFLVYYYKHGLRQNVPLHNLCACNSLKLCDG